MLYPEVVLPSGTKTAAHGKSFGGAQLLEKQIKPEMVQEDLQKLLILFPENEELQKIINERGK